MLAEVLTIWHALNCFSHLVIVNNGEYTIYHLDNFFWLIISIWFSVNVYFVWCSLLNGWADLCDSLFLGLIHLESLNLSFTLVTDSGLKKLSGLTSLRSLNLDVRNVTDAGLAVLTSKQYSCTIYASRLILGRFFFPGFVLSCDIFWLR